MDRVEAVRKLQGYTGDLRARGATGLYLFGSVGRGDARADSDLDLFVDYDPHGTFNLLDLIAVKRLLQEGLGVEVDITTRAGLHPLLRGQVETEALRIF